MRSDREVKQLAHQLEFFSTLLPVPDQNISKVEFYCGLAQRATLEKLPGEGYASMFYLQYRSTVFISRFVILLLQFPGKMVYI